jgi:hypothetical protein
LAELAIEGDRDGALHLILGDRSKAANDDRLKSGQRV